MIRRAPLLGFLLTAAALGCRPTESASTQSPSNPPPAEQPAANTAAYRLAKLPSEMTAPETPRAARADDWFEDMTVRSSIEFRYQNGCESRNYTLLETVGGGVALFDFDRDGDLDLYVNGGGELSGTPPTVKGRAGALFRNDGDWKFSDVTAALGLGADDLYTHGCAAGDVNRDGWPDLLVTGYGGCRLYLNREGTGFEDATQKAGLTVADWFTAAAFGDYDRDGWLDLYVTAYADWKPGGKKEICLYDELEGKRRDVCPPGAYEGRQDRLWHNRGDGTFEDVCKSAGLLPNMRGLGVLAADFDEDGWMDWFVANDAQENQLYFGGPKLPLTERGALSGAAYSLLGEREGSMGVDVGDFNGDGLLDLFYTNFTQQDNTLLRGEGGRQFANVVEQTGLAGPSRLWVGFGGGFADFDRDGWPDLYVLNGHVFYDAPGCPYRQPPQLFQNRDGAKFEQVTQHGGPYFSVPHPARGAAVGDIDNDGSPDLAIVHQNEPLVLLRNRRESSSWVRFHLQGTKSNPDGYGVKITLRAGDRNWTQWVAGGRGYLSQSDLRPLFALADDGPVEATVVWPGGAVEVFADCKLRETNELVEGNGAAPVP